MSNNADSHMVNLVPMSKDKMPADIGTPRTIIRLTTTDDLKQIATWPDYAGSDDIRSVQAPSSRMPDGRFWWEQIGDLDRCHYSIVTHNKIIGFHAFVQIDWEQAIVKNMGCRIHRDYLGQGYGTETLRPLLNATITAGIRIIRLDVNAVNERAIRCYQSSGMRIAGDQWLIHEGPPPDFYQSPFTGNEIHFRKINGQWQVRHYWMSISANQA